MKRNSQRGPVERAVWFAFGASAAMLVAVTALAAVMLLRTVSSKDEVIFNLGDELSEMERLRIDEEREARIVHSWLLTREPSERRALTDAQHSIDNRLQKLDEEISDPPTEHMLDAVADLERQHRAALGTVLDQSNHAESSDLVEAFEESVAPIRTDLDAAIEKLVQHQRQIVSDATRSSERDARLALSLLIGAAAFCALAAIGLGVLLTRAMRTQAQQRRELELNMERVALANRDLEAFAGRISHDLRNMLAPAMLATSKLKRSAAKEPAGADAVTVSRLESSLSRTLRTMEGLLAFSRAGHPEDPLVTSDAREVLDGVLEEVQPARLDVDAEIDVAVAGPSEVRCGAGLLHVVLANLVGNALKYMAGRPERVVRVRIDGGAEWVTVTVEDTGPGIPRDQLGRIFEAFYRVPGQTIGGTGIGLATVKRIVEAHEGHVNVSSDLGRGTRFVVVLPSANGPLHPAHEGARVKEQHH